MRPRPRSRVSPSDPSTCSPRGPANICIRKEIDPVTLRTIGFELFGTFGQATRFTLDQVKAAGPTRDYDGRYGSPQRFIEAIYRESQRASRE